MAELGFRPQTWEAYETRGMVMETGVIDPSCCLWRQSPTFSNFSCSGHGRFVGFVSYLLNVFVPLKFVIQDYSEVSDIFSVV